MSRAGSDKYLLPILLIRAETCGEAWIKTVKAVWDRGREMPNHYEEFPSKEATVLVNVTNPLKQPRIHIADGYATKSIKIDREAYVKEILDGTIDHTVDEGNVSYTYHRRLWNWGKPVQKHDEELLKKKVPILRLCNYEEYLNGSFGTEPLGIDQIEYLIEKIQEENISRKLQVTTWLPHKDLKISGAPCLQRIWFRIVADEYLIMETHWRSRDLYKAFSANQFGMVELGKYIAKRTGYKLYQLTDFSNSLHIYQSDYEDVEGMFKTLEKRGMIVNE